MRENENLADEAETQVASETVGNAEIKELGYKIDLPVNQDDLAPPPQIEITGFGDIYNNVGPESERGIGQLEVDLATAIDDKISIEAAIAYDAESFGVGAFVIDFPIWGSDESHFQQTSKFDHVGIVVGLFDVPFGLDYHVYPSIDRKLITGPVAVANTHDGWNDFGVQAYMENRWFNAVIYGTNGYGYEYTDVNDEAVEVEMQMAVGGRLGIKPFGMLELGASYASFINEERKNDMALLGFDIQLNIRQFSFKGEYIRHSIGLAQEESAANNGFYTQAMYAFGKFYIVGRYGMFLEDSPEAEALNSTSLGAGWIIIDGCEARIEHKIYSELRDNRTLFQVVVGF